MLFTRRLRFLSYINITCYSEFAENRKLILKLDFKFVDRAFLWTAQRSPRQRRGDLAIPEAPNRNQDVGSRIPSEVVSASATGGGGRRTLLRNLHRAHSLSDRAAGAGSCVRTTLRRGGGELLLFFFFFLEESSGTGHRRRHSLYQGKLTPPQDTLV